MLFIFLIIVIIIFAGFVNGVIMILRLFTNRKKPISINDAKNLRRIFLQQVILDLENERQKEEAIPSLLEKYKKELKTLQSDITIPLKETPTPVYTQNIVRIREESRFFSSWYEKNSIAFLLYFGAFLIVCASVIFLSFTWSSLDNITRFMSFAVFTFLFGFAGFIVYKLPKVSQAGVTFLGIAALLLPLNGAAFQRFVVVSTDYNAMIWFVTSCICLVVYYCLFRFLPNKFYAIIINISSLSLIESFINLSSPDIANFIFGGIITSYILYALYFRVLKSYKDDLKEVFNQSSQIMLVLSIVIGFILMLTKGPLFTWQTALSLYLSSFYFYLRYALLEKEVFSIANIFFFIATFFLGKYLVLPDFSIAVLLVFTTFANLGIGYLRKETKIMNNSLKSAYDLGIMYSFLTILYCLFTLMEGKLITIIVVMSTMYYLIAYFFTKRSYLIYFLILGIVGSTFSIHNFYIFPILQNSNLLPFTYLLVMTVLAYIYKDLDENKDPLMFGLVITSILSFIPGFFGVFTDWSLLSQNTKSVYIASEINFVAVAVIQFVITAYLTIKIKQSGSIIAPVVLFFIATVGLLRVFDVPLSYFPFWGVMSSGITIFVSYGLSRISKSQTKALISLEKWEKAQKFGVFVAVVLSIFAVSIPGRTTILGQSIILSLFLTTLYLTFFWQRKFIENIGYFASFFSLITLLRVFYFFEITNIQFYLQPLCYYLIGCGMYKVYGKKDNAQGFLAIGACLSVFFLLMNSFGMSGILYAVYLLFESLIFISVAITTRQDLLKYIGLAGVMLAIFSQTSEYIFALPKWIGVGALGIIIIVVATYLMSKRKDDL